MVFYFSERGELTLGVFDYSTDSFYGGEHFKVVQKLGGGLVLAVKKLELEEGKFPITTYVIPDQD